MTCRRCGRQAPKSGLLGRPSSPHDPTSLQQWPTPRAIYGEHSGMADEKHLTGRARAAAPVPPATAARLNPAFVAWLMGMPDPYWADPTAAIGPRAFERWATAWSRRLALWASSSSSPGTERGSGQSALDAWGGG